MSNSWTKNQINVLNSTLIDPKRIAEDKLDASEIRLMKITEAVETYLQKRYPEHTIEIIGLEDIRFQSTKLAFRCKNQRNVAFYVYTQTEKEELDDLVIRDMLQARLLDGEINSYIDQILSKAGIVNGHAVTWVTSSFGEEAPVGVAISQMVAQGVSIGVSGQIFMQETGNKRVDLGDLANLLSKKGLRGILSVWIMDGLPTEKASASWAKDYCRPAGIKPVKIKM